MADLGANLAALRELRGLTRSDLAGLARVSYAFIRQLETGERNNPRTDTLGKIANALGVTIDELRAGEWTATPEARTQMGPRESLLREINSVLQDLSDETLVTARELLISLRRTSVVTVH